MKLVGALVLAVLLCFGMGAQSFYKGLDLSFMEEIEARGVKLDPSGGDIYSTYVDSGINIVRIRLWNKPARGFYDKDHSIKFALKLKSYGFKILLDLHYSDTWADPGSQTLPREWVGTKDLGQAVTDWTRDVISTFIKNGVKPDMVQVGNEVSNGFLWPYGRLVGENRRNWIAFTDLLKCGVKGVRESDPDIKIIIHYDNGGNRDSAEWFFKYVINEYKVDFDVIGVSYYPVWHGSLGKLTANLTNLSDKFGKKVMVVETGYPWTLRNMGESGNFVENGTSLLDGYPASPDGQYKFIKDLIAVVKSVPYGIGVVYWAPDLIYIPGYNEDNPYENQALFDFEHNLLPAINAFR